MSKQAQRLALVTGGGGGIGKAVCRRLAQSGMRVIVTDITKELAEQTARALDGAHLAYEMDVACEQSVQRLFQQIETEQGPLSVLVCVAGLLILPNGERPLIEDTTVDIWDRGFNVNSKGAFLCSREFLRARKKNPVDGASVVFFSSVAAQLGGYRSSASYIAAKAAVLGYAKAYARESAAYGITANTVAPGLIDTDMLRNTIDSSGALDSAAKTIPLQRIGTVEDVANAVDYLVSPQASYLTGSVIDVNGGYRMQ